MSPEFNKLRSSSPSKDSFFSEIICLISKLIFSTSVSKVRVFDVSSFNISSLFSFNIFSRFSILNSKLNFKLEVFSIDFLNSGIKVFVSFKNLIIFKISFLLVLIIFPLIIFSNSFNLNVGISVNKSSSLIIIVVLSISFSNKVSNSFLLYRLE